MTGSDKPKVYWREAPPEHDPADSCWAVKVPKLDIGFDSWREAYCYAYLSVWLQRVGL